MNIKILQDFREKLRTCWLYIDSSEHRHNLEFMDDVIHNVLCDVTCGNYSGAEKDVLRTQLLGSIYELQQSLKSITVFITKELK